MTDISVIAGAERPAPVRRVLTPREIEVIHAAADGAPNKQIAWRLGIKTRTVEAHLANVRNKIGARSTRQIIAMLALGEIDIGGRQ